jgi:hypothetical protein
MRRTHRRASRREWPRILGLFTSLADRNHNAARQALRGLWTACGFPSRARTFCARRRDRRALDQCLAPRTHRRPAAPHYRRMRSASCSHPSSRLRGSWRVFSLPLFYAPSMAPKRVVGSIGSRAREHNENICNSPENLCGPELPSIPSGTVTRSVGVPSLPNRIRPVHATSKACRAIT